MNFITFGGPTPSYHKRVVDICTQASGENTPFTKITGFTDNDLKTDPSFWKKHGNFIKSNPRGYGYWLWKPYLIKKTLDSIGENEILVYADAGCFINLNENSLKRFYEYIDMVKNSSTGIISFQMNIPEFHYNKYHTIQNVINDSLHNMEEMNRIINSGQCHATVIILCKKRHCVNIVNKWWKYAEQYDLIDDTHIKNEYPEFKDHRHDQSIYSLLVKQNGAIFLKDETYFRPNWHIDGANYPFWAARIK